MKKKKKEPKPTKLDELQADNAVLKLKLETEFGAKMGGDGEDKLPPEIENAWLNSVYNFEQNYKNAKRTSVYNLIGKPAFKKAHELKNKREISKELKRIEKLMEEKGVALSCICEYDDETIYRFITEELFEHEMDDMKMPGWVTNFIYEEFHPNHEHDIKQRAEEFFDSFFNKKWDPEFIKIYYNDKIVFNNREFTFELFSDAIGLIQSSVALPEGVRENNSEVEFDLEKQTGKIKGNIQFTEAKRGKRKEEVTRPFEICLRTENDFWIITEIKMPFLNEG